MQALVLLIAMCLFGFSIDWGGGGSSGDRIQSTLIPIWPPFLYSLVCSQISPYCLDLKLKIQRIFNLGGIKDCINHGATSS